MRFYYVLFAALLGLCTTALGQTISGIGTTTARPLPFKEIPAYPEDFSCGNIMGRMIDALGFRYYWATEGLKAEDLEYKPSTDSRATQETLEHLYGLSTTILNAFKKEANIRPSKKAPEMTFEQRRKATLENLKTASDLLKANSNADLSEYKIIFKRGERSSEFPIWNLINGPIADAMYHVGQVVAFRRASGNPMNPGVNVFMGTAK